MQITHLPALVLTVKRVEQIDVGLKLLQKAKKLVETNRAHAGAVKNINAATGINCFLMRPTTKKSNVLPWIITSERRLADGFILNSW